MKKEEPCYIDWEKYACCIECAMCEQDDCPYCDGDARDKAIEEAKKKYKTIYTWKDNFNRH